MTKEAAIGIVLEKRASAVRNAGLPSIKWRMAMHLQVIMQEEMQHEIERVG